MAHRAQASTSSAPCTAHRDYTCSSSSNHPLVQSESNAVITAESHLDQPQSQSAINDSYPYTLSQIHGAAALTSGPTIESLEGHNTQQDSYTQTQPCASASQQPPPNPSSCWGALIPVSKNPKCGRMDLDSTEPLLLHSVGRRPVFRDAQGFNRTNDLVIDDNRVSGHHFEIWREFVTVSDEQGDVKQHTVVRLRDLSSNGTFVRRQRVGKDNITILHDGVDIALNINADIEINDKGQEVRVPSYSWVFKYHNPQELQKDAPPTLPHLMAMRYEILQVLGKGSFATVYRAVDRSTGDYRAIKIMDKRRFEKNPKTTMMLQREVAIMRGLKHRYIVSYIDGFEDEQYIFVVMELVEGGDLLDFVSAYGGLQEWQAIEIAYMVCEAIAYLHQRGIAHRDLKPENLLLTPGENPVCKVTDFGLAKINTNSTFLRTMCGTPAYLAPEVVLQSRELPGYSFAVDAWSIGVVIYACIVNSSPFPEPEAAEGQALPDLAQQMKTRQIDVEPLLECGVSNACIDFLKRFMTNNPAKRMTAYDALSHPWLAPAVRRRRSTTSISALQRNPSGRIKTPAEVAQESTPADPTSAQTERFWLAEDSQLSGGTPSLAHSETHSHESSIDDDGPCTGGHGNGSPISDAGSYSQRLSDMRLESDARASGEFDLDIGWRELPDRERLMADYTEWQASQTDSAVKSSPESQIKSSQNSEKSTSHQFTKHLQDQGNIVIDPECTPASIEMSAITSQGIKRKAPGSAFSSDSSLRSGDSKPSLLDLETATTETIDTTPATSAAITFSASTQTAPLSPTSSLSSLSEVNETQPHQYLNHTSTSRRAARQGTASSRGKASASRRRSIRLASVAVPSYAESHDNDGRNLPSSSKTSSTSMTVRTRSRKQRRLST